MSTLQRQDSQQMVDTFLNMIRSVQSKQQFLARVNDFDMRMMQEGERDRERTERGKSSERGLPEKAPQKPKNPFKTGEQNFKGRQMQGGFAASGGFAAFNNKTQPQMPIQMQSQIQPQSPFNTNYQPQNFSYQQLPSYQQPPQNPYQYPPSYPARSNHSRSQQNFYKPTQMQQPLIPNVNQKDYDDLRDQFLKGMGTIGQGYKGNDMF